MYSELERIIKMLNDHNYEVDIDPDLIPNVYSLNNINKYALCYYTSMHMQYLSLLHGKMLIDAREGYSYFKTYFTCIHLPIPIIEQWLNQHISPEKYAVIRSWLVQSDACEGKVNIPVRIAWYYYLHVEKELIKTTEPERNIDI